MSVNSLLATLLLAMVGGGAPATPGAPKAQPAPADITILKVEKVNDSNPGDVSLQAGSKVKISLKADGVSDLKWINLDTKNLQMTLSDDKKSAVLTSRNAGQYTILVYGAKKDSDASNPPVATDPVIIKINVKGSQSDVTPKPGVKPPTNPIAKALQDAHAQDKTANQDGNLHKLGIAIDNARASVNDANVTNWDQVFARFAATAKRQGVAGWSPQLQNEIFTQLARLVPGSRPGAALTDDQRGPAAEFFRLATGAIDQMVAKATR